MYKLSAVVVLALALCVAADPIRQRPLRRRVFARQEALPTPAPTGYPLAGITPEIPFELPTETDRPDVVTQQPDEVYGPPEFDAQQPDETEVVQKPDEIYGPPETEVTHQPDEVYGPPEIEATTQHDPEIFEEVEAEEEAEDVAEDLDNVEEVVIVDEQPARLVYQRRQPARLTKSKIVRPKNFVYTARFQTFPQK